VFRNKKSDQIQRLWGDRALDASLIPLGIIPGYNTQVMFILMDSLTSLGTIDVQFCRRMIMYYSKQTWFMENIPAGQFGVFRSVFSSSIVHSIKNMDLEKNPPVFDDPSALIRSIPILFYQIMHSQKENDKQLAEWVILSTLITTSSGTVCVSTYAYLFFLRKCMTSDYLSKSLLEALELLLVEIELFEEKVPLDLFTASTENSRCLKSLIKLMTYDKTFGSSDDPMIPMKAHILDHLQKSDSPWTISAFLISIISGFMWNKHPILTVIRGVIEVIGDESQIYAALSIPFCVLPKMNEPNELVNLNFPANIMNQLVAYDDYYKLIGDFTSAKSKTDLSQLGKCLNFECRVTRLMILHFSRESMSRNSILAKETKENLEIFFRDVRFDQDKDLSVFFKSLFQKFARNYSNKIKFMNRIPHL
jgi:hypothetical protein